jgi:radical SAM protein with 4Fe4S-binding SPASM domain
LTQKCLQHCLYCSSNSSSKKKSHLSFNTVKAVLDDFYCLGGKIVELSGGEPLLYDHIEETINYASNIGLNVQLFTSSCFENAVDIGKLKNVDKFYVNLQAPNKATHDYLTQTPGSFDRVLKLIKNLKAEGKWVGTHIIPLSMNIDELDEYVALAEHIGIDNVSLLRYVEQGRGKQNILSLNPDEIQHLFSFIMKNKENSQPEIKAGCPLDFSFTYKKGQTPVQCKAGISRCVIRSTGHVIPCPAFKDEEKFIAGNIKEKNLIEIWNTSKVFRQLRNFQFQKLQGPCRKCPFLVACKGRCTAQRLLTKMDLNKGPDPYCPLQA